MLKCLISVSRNNKSIIILYACKNLPLKEIEATSVEDGVDGGEESATTRKFIHNDEPNMDSIKELEPQSHDEVNTNIKQQNMLKRFVPIVIKG